MGAERRHPLVRCGYFMTDEEMSKFIQDGQQVYAEELEKIERSDRIYPPMPATDVLFSTQKEVNRARRGFWIATGLALLGWWLAIGTWVVIGLRKL